MENREFYIDKDGFKIHAKLDFPEVQKEKMPLLILVHGLTGHMEEVHILKVAEIAVKSGYACLRVEMYGHGMSDGNFCNHNIAQWVLDMAYVIDYAEKLDFVSDIYLSGHSQGGLTSMLTAGLKGDKIKGLMPLSPAVCLIDCCKTGIWLDGSSFDVVNIPEELHFWEDKYVTGNYVRVARSLRIEDAIAAYHGPVFLVHGTGDETVPVSDSINADKLYENSVLALIPEDTDCYDYHLDQVAEVIEKWLGEQYTANKY
ncbi:MAG: alpha/beta fold hydrolase [Clostridiales bacterium]|nr:alpha/beta fold hydrolase [Candidatus Blautia equi]